MFFLAGWRTVRRDVKGRAPEREHCGRCGLVSEFRYQRQRTYFTLFFVPILPISKAESIITCSRCDGSYYANYSEHRPEVETPDNSKTVLVCPTCSGKMRIPVKPDKAIRVTCPQCRDQFTVTVNRS